jgi:mRNA-degrading endonuclease RelE of RelBE toxin-antitoxin system
MARAIRFASRFSRTWEQLTEAQQERILDIIVELPALMKNPHQHSGYGFRRLHGTLYYETRIDLRWRLVMKMYPDEIIVFDVLNHDQVRRLMR